MSGQIYLLQGGDVLHALHEAPYAKEVHPQTLLEKYPELLAGEQIDAAAPRRWVLVAREVGVPGETDRADRWSLDHLFLDQDGVPTLVEVKRSSDTRIRREVVGQMLDYAANAVIYWPFERLVTAFEATCAARDTDPEEVIRDLVEADPDDEEAVEAFWTQARTNLRAGRIRLLFVADVIPQELRRIVEFLNEQMDPAEVLAVEIRQFVGEGLQTLVPRVVGQTAEAQGRKATLPRERVKWDRDAVLAMTEEMVGAVERGIVARVLDWAEENGVGVYYGRGTSHPSATLTVYHRNRSGQFHKHQFASFWPHENTVEVQFQHMKGPFTLDRLRPQLFERFNAIEDIKLDPKRLEKRPSFPISVLADEERLVRLLDLARWFTEEIRAT